MGAWNKPVITEEERMASIELAASRGCIVCGATPCLYKIRSRRYCAKHKAEAFADRGRADQFYREKYAAIQAARKERKRR